MVFWFDFLVFFLCFACTAKGAGGGVGGGVGGGGKSRCVSVFSSAHCLCQRTLGCVVGCVLNEQCTVI